MKAPGSRNLKAPTQVRHLLRVGFAGLLLVAGFSCQFQSEKPESVLIIAVDAIPPVYCDEGAGQEILFRTLCQESVRFTHAFTTSTSAQAALASILTGLYPFEHRLRDNSTHSALAAGFETLAERALMRGYRTSLVSGGPPVWRTSGLGQGFETVEDNVTLSMDRYYRKFGDSVDLFLGWLEQGDMDRAFFSVLYAPDHRFPGTNVTDALSAEVERLSLELKKKKLWDSTHVVLVGLSGPGAHLYDPVAMALTNRTTQVPLLVKPARKPRDTPLVWKVDANVSLVDLGTGLRDVLNAGGVGAGESGTAAAGAGGTSRSNGALSSVETRTSSAAASPMVQAPMPPSFEVQSLAPVFRGESMEFPVRRMIPVESAWADWRMKWGVRYALLNGENLFIHDKDPLIYNMLVDREQMLPLNPEDPNFRGPLVEFEKKVQELEWPAFEIEDPIAWKLLKRLETDPLLAVGLPPDWQKSQERLPAWLKNWVVAALARVFFREQNLKELERWALGRGFTSLGAFLGRRRVNARLWLSEDVCGPGLTSPECQRSIVKKANQWIRMVESRTETKTADSERGRELFFRDIEYWWMDRSIHMVNAAQGFQWDLRDENEVEPQYFHFLAKFHRSPEVRSQVGKYLLQIGERD